MPASPASMRRAFLLSPANSAGQRMQLLTREGSKLPLSLALRSQQGAPLGEVFAFASSLYFRGKLAYARAFASPGRALVIAPGAGLVSVDERIRLAELRAFGSVPVDSTEPRFRAPLERDATLLRDELGPTAEVVLLGSVASDKYTAILLSIFGERLLFPPSFVGRGDMSRGGLLLRSAAAGTPLEYRPVQGATLRGQRPPKLPKLPRARAAS